MTFDAKRMKTLKWLEELSGKRITGLKVAYNPYWKMVLCRYGRLYANNGYILASIEYPEFFNIGDESWLKLVKYMSEDGKHLETPFFENLFPHPNGDRLFENMFIHPTEVYYSSANTFNPYLIAECMRPFKINGISPNFVQRCEYLEFTGHNKDVSIRVLTIGEGRKWTTKQN